MAIPERTVFSEANGRINPAVGGGEAFEMADRDMMTIVVAAGAGGDYSLQVSMDNQDWMTVADKLVGEHVVVMASDGFEASVGNMVTAPASLRCIPRPCGFIRLLTVTPGTEPSATALSIRI